MGGLVLRVGKEFVEKGGVGTGCFDVNVDGAIKFDFVFLNYRFTEGVCGEGEDGG